MIDAFHSLWTHILHVGDRYGVNAVVFAILYVAHHPLFWGTMAWLAARARRKKPVAGVVALAVFFWLMPYLYVFAFGHGLPWWAYAVGMVILLVGGTHAVHEIRRRITSAQKNSAAPSPKLGPEV